MNSNENITRSDSLYLGHIGWRYYNSIKKKAMEQEFSWSGLVLSLSIAFFIVIVSSLSLNVLKNSILRAGISESSSQNIYRLENFNNYSLDNYLQADIIGYHKLNNINYPSIA